MIQLFTCKYIHIELKKAGLHSVYQEVFSFIIIFFETKKKTTTY